jgi:hypothetical protein
MDRSGRGAVGLRVGGRRPYAGHHHPVMVMATVRPFDLGNLRKHCLGDAGKRLSRLSAIPFANCRARMLLR